MVLPLLKTKLYIPPVRPELVPRPHLIERLNAGLHRKLTLISAPAGYGKTTLLSEWVASCERPVAWVSLDKGDNDPTRFWAYFIAGLQTVRADAAGAVVGEAALAMLQSHQPPPIEATLTTLMNEMTERADAPPTGRRGEPVESSGLGFALVLDDYHTIEARPIHSGLAFLLHHLPPQMHLVIATRADPPLPLSRLRGRGHLAELRTTDLCFVPDEAAAFLNQVMGLGLSAQDVAALVARTEGWIVALHIAALSMQRRDTRQVTSFIAALTGSHRHILDYLADEVLLQQPERIRSFLLRTAILDRLIGSLCDAVTGRDDGQQMLRNLDAANLFVVPLDDERAWYRYHHLFAESLRAELDEESEAALHLKAARWFEVHELLPEAVKHALASGDPDEAARVIALAAEEALRTGSFMTLLGWLNALPDELVRTNYELATYKGLLLNLTRKFAEAAAYADDAERSFPPDATSSSRGRLLSLKAQVALCRGISDSAVQLSSEALNYLGDGDTFFRSLTLTVLGQVLQMQGDIAAAADVYRQAVLARRRSGDQQDVMHVLINLVASLNELGQRREALATCQQAINEGTAQPSQASPWAETAYLVLGLLSYEANQLDLARGQVLRALDVCRQMNFNDGVLLGHYFLAQVELASGDIGAMLEAAREVRQFAARSNLELPYGPWLSALEAQASLQQDDLASVIRWAEAAQLTPADTPHPFYEVVYFVYVRLLLAQDRPEEARTLLSAMERSAQEGKRYRKLITIYLQQALVQQVQGYREHALQHIEDALRLAAPEGYLRAFLDEGRGIVDLLPQVRAYQGGSIALAFVDQVLSASGVEPVILRTQPLIEPLSERELEVLQLIAEGLTNREVGQRLYISLGTVKTHTSNIYGKLGVHTRTQAVVRARALAIL